MDPKKLAAFEAALADLLGSAMVPRWVVVAETFESDGTLCLADLTSPGLAYWDFTGMLTAAAQGRSAQPAWSYASENDEDS